MLPVKTALPPYGACLYASALGCTFGFRIKHWLPASRSGKASNDDTSGLLFAPKAPGLSTRLPTADGTDRAPPTHQTSRR